MNIQFLQAHVCSSTDAFEPLTHDVECVFGGVEQHSPGARREEMPQTRGVGGHGDGQLSRGQYLNMNCSESEGMPT
jgi:hypothetical protein